jgi:phosphohistidine phosphatase
MDQLYVLRHGIAVASGTTSLPDNERPLTPDGEKRMYQIAKALSRLDLELDRIFTSPLPRALRTAEIVAEVLGHPELVEKANALHVDRDGRSIRDWALSRTEANVMIVGHNPSLSDLVALLVTGQCDVPLCELRKGGIAALTANAGSRMELDWLARPRLFRELAD